jgi:hypothetical protein
MPETHAGAHGGSVDDQFFRRYRALLDAEDCAFDELEHAYEDGDRSAFDVDLEVWRSAVTRRESFLETNGFTAATPLVL